MLCMQHQPEAFASDLGDDQSRYLLGVGDYKPRSITTRRAREAGKQGTAIGLVCPCAYVRPSAQ